MLAATSLNDGAIEHTDSKLIGIAGYLKSVNCFFILYVFVAPNWSHGFAADLCGDI